MKELFENLQQFSANERIEHVELDKRGNPRAPKSATFTYVVQIHEVSPGRLDVDEYRNGSTSQSFPANLVTSGTVAHALIFHPDIIGDYTVTDVRRRPSLGRRNCGCDLRLRAGSRHHGEEQQPTQPSLR